ncbi:hypothetical protein Dsin_024435 [Dipteronia sinensis]|uniref:RNase H type-1 domain-containing protein n=1 Tax=Dipteronia sinensis TaxID=43782 RepID=A0AAE0DVW9_9ROSI|nr:hypothetical protein Dsin_024435 [Dipteronia sinensis]
MSWWLVSCCPSKTVDDWFKGCSGLCPKRIHAKAWSSLFFATVWTVWKARNGMVFRGKEVDFIVAANMVKFRVVWWFKHYGKGSTDAVTTILLNIKDCCTKSTMVKQRSLGTWIPPSLDVLKFNVDGAVRGSPGQAGMGGGGGVLRNSRGRVLCLFSNHLGISDSNSAEIMAIHKASEICASKPDFIGRDIVIVSDSMTAVTWVNDRSFGSVKHVNLIYKIRGNLIKLGKTVVIYNSRASNSFADMLAKKG